MSLRPEDIPGSSKQNEGSQEDKPNEKKLRKLLRLREKLGRKKKELEEREVQWDDEALEERLFNEEMEIGKTLVEIERKLVQYRVIKDLPNDCKILLEGGTDLNIVISDTGDEILNDRLTKALREKCHAKNSAKNGIYLVRDELEAIFASVREEQLQKGLPRPLPAKEDRANYDELVRNVASIINRSVKEARFTKGTSMFDDYLSENDQNAVIAPREGEDEFLDERPALPMDAILGIIRERGEEEQRNGGGVEDEGEVIEISDSDGNDKGEDSDEEEEGEQGDEMEVEERVEEEGEAEVAPLFINGEDNSSSIVVLSSDDTDSMSEASKSDDDLVAEEDSSSDIVMLDEDDVPATPNPEPVEGSSNEDVVETPQDAVQPTENVVKPADDIVKPTEEIAKPMSDSGEDQEERRLGDYHGLETISIVNPEPGASSSNKENADDEPGFTECAKKTAGNDGCDEANAEDVVQLEDSVQEIPETAPEVVEATTTEVVGGGEGTKEQPKENTDKPAQEIQEITDSPDNVSISTRPSWLRGETSAELAASFVAHRRELEDEDVEVVFERIQDFEEPVFRVEPELERTVRKWVQEGKEAANKEAIPVIELSDDDEGEVQELKREADDDVKIEDGKGSKRALDDLDESPPASRPRLDEAGPSCST